MRNDFQDIKSPLWRDGRLEYSKPLIFQRGSVERQEIEIKIQIKVDSIAFWDCQCRIGEKGGVVLLKSGNKQWKLYNFKLEICDKEEFHSIEVPPSIYSKIHKLKMTCDYVDIDVIKKWIKDHKNKKVKKNIRKKKLRTNH